MRPCLLCTLTPPFLWSVQEKVLKCLYGWLRYDYIHTRELTSSTLLTGALPWLRVQGVGRVRVQAESARERPARTMCPQLMCVFVCVCSAPFDALAHPRLFDVTKDVICELLRSSENVERDASAVQLLVPRVMQLAPAYKAVGAHSLCLPFASHHQPLSHPAPALTDLA